MGGSHQPRTLISKEKKSATAQGKEQLEDVKAKLDSVHKLLKKQVNFAEDVEAIDVDTNMDEEEDVNFVTGSCFQNPRSGNQSGYKNSYGMARRVDTTRVHSTRNPSATTTTAATKLMEVLSTRIHHHRLERVR